MTALLYHSYSSGLSKNHKLIIDRQVSINRKKVSRVVRLLFQNAKYRTKHRIRFIRAVTPVIDQLLDQSVTTVSVPLLPIDIHRLVSNEQDKI